MFKPLLDQPDAYRVDHLKVYDSILALGNQVEQAWVEASNQTLNTKCNLAKNIVISGMGGSALSGRIIRSLDQYILNVPLEIVTNYRLPNYVSKSSLVILSSYSGDTEETLSAAHDALARGASIFVITTGGKLLAFAKKNKIDFYLIDPKFNPSRQPRLGLGYSIIAVFAILTRCGFINFGQKDVDEIKKLLDDQTRAFQKETPLDQNPAKAMAEKLRDRAVVMISANHLNGTVHAVKNMLNENSKVFVTNFDLPELDHHFLEGLSFPKGLKDVVHFILFNSDQYPKAIQSRLSITRQILAKHGYATTVIKPESTHPTLQAFEVLYFGAFLSYYLAIQAHVDPGPIPSVDYLKKELAKI
jgi:glucose/mannose-6-phosphate isomerase